MKFMNGLPTTSIRDIAIQKRETDLVIATFGRGFYVIDDYSPLQKMKKEDFENKAIIFPIKDGVIFNQSMPLGHIGKSFQGASFFQTDNAAIGTTFTYYLKDDYKSIKEKEKKLKKKKKKQPISFYPSVDSMRLEDREESAYIIAVITDEQGNAIRQLIQPAKKDCTD